jgi:hypothetical protein
MYVLDKAYKVLEHVVSSNKTIPVENGTREEADYEDRESFIILITYLLTK